MKHLLLLGLVAIVLSTFTAAPALSDQPRDITEKLKTVLDDTVKKFSPPGGVLAVRFPDGNEVILVSGYAELGSERPMTPDLHFRIGSVTKTFTSTAMLILIGEGKARLQDTVEKWLPNLVPGGDRITIKMLLNHTGGLYDFTHDEEYQDEYIDNLLKVWTPRELLEIAWKHQPSFPPGEKWEYTNTGYIVLGLLIEKISGTSVEAFITERIIRELGLTNTSFPTSPDVPVPYANGYFDEDDGGIFKPEEDVTRQDPSVIWSAGAIISTPGDLLNWLDAILAGKLLDERTQRARMAFDVRVPENLSPNSSFGLGIANNDGVIGHSGAVLGYTTNMYHKDGVSIVTYSNSYYVNNVNAANEIFDGAMRVLFPK